MKCESCESRPGLHRTIPPRERTALHMFAKKRILCNLCESVRREMIKRGRKETDAAATKRIKKEMAQIVAQEVFLTSSIPPIDHWYVIRLSRLGERELRAAYEIAVSAHKARVHAEVLHDKLCK